MPFSTRTTALLATIAGVGFAFGQFTPAPPVVEVAPAPAPATPASPKRPAPTQQQLASLTQRLNSDEFKTRENAQIELSKFATEHPEVTLDPILANYIDSSTVPEARYRLRAILYSSRKSLYLDNPPGFVGIVMLPIGNMVQVREVVRGSAAERDGLLVGDRILSIDGRTFSPETDPSLEFSAFVMSKKSGDRVILKVMRNNVESELAITLGKRPEELMDSRFDARFDLEFKIWLEAQIARLQAGQ